jgi:hypothetical protein
MFARGLPGIAYPPINSPRTLKVIWTLLTAVTVGGRGQIGSRDDTGRRLTDANGEDEDGGHGDGEEDAPDGEEGVVDLGVDDTHDESREEDDAKPPFWDLGIDGHETVVDVGVELATRTSRSEARESLADDVCEGLMSATSRRLARWNSPRWY